MLSSILWYEIKTGGREGATLSASYDFKENVKNILLALNSVIFLLHSKYI